MSYLQCTYDVKPGSVAPPVQGLPSTDWHVKEALEYFVRVMLPTQEYHDKGDSAYEFNFNFDGVVGHKYFDGDRFSLLVLSHRLQCIFSSSKVAPRYGNLPGLNLLWTRLFNLMDIVMQRLNHRIATSSDLLPAFGLIRMLMHVELNFVIPTWRVHAEGFGALIKNQPRGLSELFSDYPDVPQYVLLVSSMCNTTSPPDDQITHMSNWSDQDIAIAYSHTGCHGFPCPTAIFQAMIRITHLRTLVAAGTQAPEWERLAREAHAKIQSVDPRNWGEPYSTDGEIYVLSARVYQAAVALYAILALPPQLAAVFAFPQPGGGGEQQAVAENVEATAAKPSFETCDACGAKGPQYARDERDELDLAHAALEDDCGQTAQVRYRSSLFRLFRRATAELPESGGLAWPSAVLGVAFQGHAEEQAILLDHVGYLRGWPGSESGATSLYDKLIEFWGSGKKHWDQCFYEPTSVLT
ncbi:C6 finger domain-containing protein [Cordyceps javanica]|uniref:C6 finger domain-containing protein n=1 Tax=Cordyceps javanica TaxID=43265 RepID=A0A545VJR8_9HYPO|nr:C6 finger domain-containing protein [Cordyceps javanica]TQW01974.1 C6 finger domain protein [Cordyceps javanica]